MSEAIDKHLDQQVIYARKLSKMIQHQTLSSDAGGAREAFIEYEQTLEELFPTIFEVAEKLSVEESFLYRIKGQKSDLPNAVLAHSDVVGTFGQWKHQPFDGVIDDGRLYGRGTLDDKGMLCAAMCALEELLSEGFTLEQDLYIISTHTEESTAQGILNCKDYFEKENIHFGTVLDEGGLLTDNVFPRIARDIALVGLGEKGYLDIRFTAKSKGGHSSIPPVGNPVARLSEMIHYIESHKIFKPKLIPTIRALFEEIAPHLPFSLRLFLGNSWLFGGLFPMFLPKISPTIGALMTTTIVFTRLSGSDANNVIPSEATAVANIRNICGESEDEVIDKLVKIAARHDISCEVLYNKPASSITDHSDEMVRDFMTMVENHYDNAISVPYIFIGATDACRLDDLSERIILFNPIRISSEEFETFHGIDESVSLKDLANAVTFMKKYLRQL